MKFISMFLEISFNQFSAFPAPVFTQFENDEVPATKKRYACFPNKLGFRNILFSKMRPSFFCISEVFLVWSNEEIWGCTVSKIQKSWHLEILVFRIMKSGCYCTNLEQITSRKLFNLFFKHISLINDPKVAIIIPTIVLMIFL